MIDLGAGGFSEGGFGAGFGEDGAGLFLAGGAMGAMSNLVPPTPDSPLTPAAIRTELEKYRQLQAEGLITQEDYDSVKARILGLIN